MTKFTREIQGGAPTLVIAGDLDLSNQTEFHEALHSLNVTCPSVRLDFCRCEYFDSSAITEMVKFNRERAKYQKIMLLSLSAGALRILKIVGLDQLFPIGDCTHLGPSRHGMNRDELLLRRRRRELFRKMPERFR